MDLQFWIWLIVIVVSLIARAMKKKPEEEVSSKRPANRPNTPQPEFNQKPLTFEELLREIQSSKAPEPVSNPSYPATSSREGDYVDYDDHLEDEEEDLEKVDYQYRDDDATIAAYEKAKQEAFLKPSLEETMKLSDTDMKFGHFKGYQQVEQWVPTTNYAKEFQYPESFKKAFIMSEILKPKF
ncbi:MAG: hypothetical protein DI538_19175 [Azospira oryzae]|nr:MAG: hypothetical protein DI538_19175 [Azospira oryzae]